MNERIKELWEESTVSTWPRPGKFTAGEYDYHLKGFAESIVRECVKVLEEDDGATPNSELLKEHFGVEG